MKSEPIIENIIHNKINKQFKKEYERTEKELIEKIPKSTIRSIEQCIAISAFEIQKIKELGFTVAWRTLFSEDKNKPPKVTIEIRPNIDHPRLKLIQRKKRIERIKLKKRLLKLIKQS